VVILIIDVLVFWVVVANFGICDGLRGELFHSGFDVRPIVIFELLDESISIIGHSLVRSEARVDVSTHVNTEGSVEDTGLEIGGGSGGNSAVDSLRFWIPLAEDELLEVTDSLTCTVVVTRVPLGRGILDVSLDVSHARADDFEDLELPVWVSSEGLNDCFLVVPLIIDVLVCWVVVANIGICFDLRGELLDSRSDCGPVLGFEGRDESIGVISQVLVGFEALVDVSTHINTEGSVEDTSLEVGDGSVGNSGVLHFSESESKCLEHFWLQV